jgi:hypothetical protein
MMRRSTGMVYRIVVRSELMVRSELSERYAPAFEGMEMETKDGQTTLIGEIIVLSSLALHALHVEAGQRGCLQPASTAGPQARAVLCRAGGRDAPGSWTIFPLDYIPYSEHIWATYKPYTLIAWSNKAPNNFESEGRRFESYRACFVYGLRSGLKQRHRCSNRLL